MALRNAREPVQNDDVSLFVLIGLSMGIDKVAVETVAYRKTMWDAGATTVIYS